ncbi:MAG: transketolase [Synergistaceae bacterium]|nr:transketolase [Synergistaceae bacterium]
MSPALPNPVLPDLRKFPIDALSDEHIAALNDAARRARLDAVTMVSAAGSGHPGGSFSGMEMYLSVYGVADLTPANCDSFDRDYVVVSHGHTSPGAYAALAAHGFFEAEEAVAHFRQCGSPFQGHVERGVPGIDWGSGNLGQGLSAGVGFALAQRARRHDGRVYVLMGDGGQTKGQIAEARRLAVKENLTNIVGLVDWNDIQISGHLRDVMPANLRALWESDGWQVTECDGHSFGDIYAALRVAGRQGRPTVLFCRTVMGKNGGAMEGTHEYHGKAPQGEVYESVVRGLGGDPAMLKRALDRRGTPPVKGRTISCFAPTLDTGMPFDYEGDGNDNRGAWGKAAADVGRLNRRNPDAETNTTPLLVFDCDLAPSVMTGAFKKECPENFIQCGIQEHCTATASGAAAAAGVVSVWAEFGVFGVDEVFNQQRLNDINHAGNKTVLTHVGLDVGEDGMTHQCIDYVGLLRNLFGWKLVVPADPNQTDRAVRWMLRTPGCICLAVGRSKVPVVMEAGRAVFGGDYAFEYGKAVRVREGGDGTIFALGSMTIPALAAASKLSQQGVEVGVRCVTSPLAVDEEALVEACGRGPVLTVEDHNVESGMGSVLASAMAQRGLQAKIRLLGVTGYAGSGKSPELYAAMELDAAGIAKSFVELREKS